MNSNWKAKTLTLAVLSLGILFQPIAFGYDPNAFPGKGSKADFIRSCQISNEGAALQAKGKQLESIQYFKKAVQVYPYSAGFHYNLGRAYSKMQDFSNALSCYRNALKLAPDYDKAHSNTSNLLYKLGDYRGAEEHALKATAINESNPVGWINLAQAEIGLKKAKSAKQHLQIAKRLPSAGDYAGDVAELDAKLQKLDVKTAEN